MGEENVKQFNNSKPSKRNSVLELLRLCASLWVMYYHGLSFIARSKAFSNGRIAVDFFFILSGFFFINSCVKEDDDKTWRGLLSFVWKRFKPLAVTFGICEVFSLLYFFANGMSGFIWGYLWYVPHLLFVLACYFLLRRIVKNATLFYIAVAVISAVCYALILTYITNYGIIRGFAGVGLGILISRIPSLDFKHSNTVSVIITILLFVSITVMAIFPPTIQVQDCLCLLLLFPSIIYFSANINFSCSVINSICRISFGLYAYQTVTRFLQLVCPNVPDGGGVAAIVFVLAISDLIIKKVVNKRRLSPKGA